VGEAKRRKKSRLCFPASPTLAGATVRGLADTYVGYVFQLRT
jgi:hypothetical protein